MNELREARIRNRDKSVERRLYALILHAEENTGKKVSELTVYNEKYLYELYRKQSCRKCHPSVCCRTDGIFGFSQGRISKRYVILFSGKR